MLAFILYAIFDMASYFLAVHHHIRHARSAFRRAAMSRYVDALLFSDTYFVICKMLLPMRYAALDAFDTPLSPCYAPCQLPWTLMMAAYATLPALLCC